MAGARTELAKQTVVRYIREGGLKSGDRLPAQEELRKELGFGSATIAAALHELRADRVIEVRDKIGVFVVNPDADGHAGREIGLAINALEVSAFRSSLANLIQIRLAERGWRAIPFFCMEPTLSGKLELSAFPGLRRTIEQKGIEALVTLGDFSESSLKFFRTKKLPVVFVGSLETDSARVVIDMPGFLHAAMAELRKGGCRHPGILISEALKPRLAPEFAAAGGAPELLFTGNYVADGAAAARLIQALPETARPDGMVGKPEKTKLILDKIASRKLSAALALAEIENRILRQAGQAPLGLDSAAIRNALERGDWETARRQLNEFNRNLSAVNNGSSEYAQTGLALRQIRQSFGKLYDALVTPEQIENYDGKADAAYEKLFDRIRSLSREYFTQLRQWRNTGKCDLEQLEKLRREVTTLKLPATGMSATGN